MLARVRPVTPLAALLVGLLACQSGGAGGDAPGPDAAPVPSADAPRLGDGPLAPRPDARPSAAPDASSPDADRPGDAAPAAGDARLAPADDARATPAPDVPATPAPDAGPVPVPPLPWADDPCAGVNVGDDPFAARIAAFAAADDAAPPGAPGGGLVVVGSSSIRRWEDAQRLLSAWDPVQRGVGGARLADVARWAEPLILRHHPAGVLLYAGTNDLADGRSADSVVDAYRCVAARLHAAQPGTPLLWVSITPTPARWGIWPVAAQVNARIAALADAHPSLVYVDGATTFLATGSPPDAGLFVGDGLHLSPAGYALWAEAILPAVRAHVPESTRPLPPGPPPGTYVRVDLGPSDAENGHPAGVDAFGIHWNAWPGLPGGEQALAGEAQRGLVGTRGEVTGVDLVLSGGFRANGLRNGGLAAPDFGRLGTLAVGEATQDFFYTGDPDDPGGLTLQGLTPGARHTLRLFASRASADERRVTRFVVHGGGAPAQAEVTTTGPGVGADGSNANVGELVVFTGLVPDARGRLHVDVQIAQGQFAYLNLLELEVEAR